MWCNTVLVQGLGQPTVLYVALLSIFCRYTGTIVKVHHAQGDLVKVGAPLVDIQTAAAAVAEDTAATSNSSSSSSDCDSAAGTAAESYDYDPAAPGGSSSSSSSVLAAPTVRRLARQLGVDLARVPGTGPDGRVLREDVERYKAGLVSSIADKLVDRIAAKSGPSSAGKLYAELADVAGEDGDAGSAAAGAGAGAGQPGGAAPAGTGGSGAATAGAAGGGAAQVTTRIPIRGYRRWVCMHSRGVAHIQ